MKTLIVYYSHTQNNEKLANILRRKLGADILKIEEAGKRTGFTILLDLIFNRKPVLRRHSLSLRGYAQIILVAPIWASKIASPMKAFLFNEKKNITHYSFISICGGAKGQLEKIIRQLVKFVGKKPDAVAELWINDLLSEDKKDSIRYTTGYRMADKDFEFFEPKVRGFLMQEGMPLQARTATAVKSK